MNIKAKFYSREMFFHEKVVLLLARSYFSDFQRLIRVRSNSRTNKKVSRRVWCHYRSKKKKKSWVSLLP